MTRHEPGDEQFAELAAGYALHSLEPADERRFAEHAAHCADCQRALVGYAAVAADLASAAEPADPPARLGEAIMAAAAREPQNQPAAASPLRPPLPRPGATSGARHRHSPSRAASGPAAPRAATRPAQRRRAWLAAAAAVAFIAAGAGTWAGLSRTTAAPAPAPAAACTPGEQCRHVTLTSASGHHLAATVDVRGSSVWIVPGSLRADDASTQVYVLWQITGARVPLAVGTFDIRSGHHDAIKVGGLAAAYHHTWAFAVTLEHGRTIPARPSQPVAQGQVTS